MMNARTPEVPLNVFFYEQPSNPLQVSVRSGLRVQLLEHGATIQEKPDASTNLVISCGRMGEDLPVRQMAIFHMPPELDKQNTRFLNIDTTPHIPTRLEEFEHDYLSNFLNIPPDQNLDQNVLVEMAKRRFAAPELIYAYPQVPRAGCTNELVVEGDEDEDGSIPRVAYLIGLEQSHLRIEGGEGFSTDLFKKLAPQVQVTLVIKNQRIPDLVLPNKVWQEITEPDQIIKASAEMFRRGMYPDGFPFHRFIHRKKAMRFNDMVGVSGMSYGNTTALAIGEAADYGKFFVGESGITKNAMTRNNIRLVYGRIPGTNIMGTIEIEGVPQDNNRRASVDSVEVEILYQVAKKGKVTIHGHEWMVNPKTMRPFEDFRGFKKVGDTYIVVTEEHRPCGCFELGEEAGAALDQSPEPEHTVILEKYHGFVGVGEDFNELFERMSQLQQYLTAEIPQY